MHCVTMIYNSAFKWVVETVASNCSMGVVLYKRDYIDRVKAFFNENGISSIDSDPTVAYHTTLKAFFDGCLYIIPPEELSKLKVMNPRALSLCAQIKMHEQCRPASLIVYGIGSPGYHASAFLLKWLKDKLSLDSNLCMQSATHCWITSGSIVPEGRQLLSLDIKNLYTNVPLQETVKIIQSNLILKGNLIPDKVNEITKLLDYSQPTIISLLRII